MLLLISACHGGRVDVSVEPGGSTGPVTSTTTLDRVWLLEASGPAVADTSITFAAASGRTIILRHASPDGAIFAILQFPAVLDSARAGDSLHLTVHPIAGKYELAIETPDKLGRGAEVTFSYAMHFQTPTDAATKYPSPGRFELLLVPALLAADNKVEFLPDQHPAADMIRFPVTMSGTYALVARR